MKNAKKMSTENVINGVDNLDLLKEFFQLVDGMDFNNMSVQVQLISKNGRTIKFAGDYSSSKSQNKSRFQNNRARIQATVASLISWYYFDLKAGQKIRVIVSKKGGC